MSPAQHRIWHQRRQVGIAPRPRPRSGRPSAWPLRLRQSWPGLEGIWLFGSVAEGRTHSSSDIDLAVAGLPPEALLTATAERDNLAASRQDPAIPIDLLRLESLPPHWQSRIRERGTVL